MVVSVAGQSRTSVLLLLLVATTSALIVVAFYEVRGRRTKDQPAQTQDARPEVLAPAPRAHDIKSLVPASCAERRRRYLTDCAGELPVMAPPAVGVPSPHDADEKRASSELSVWLNPPPEELDDMAKRCEVRFDMPSVAEDEAPEVTDEASAAMSLSKQERALIDRTLVDLHAELRDFAQRAAGATLGNPRPPSLEELLTELQADPAKGFAQARERLAAERAGAKAPSAGAPPSAGERLLRLWANMGDDFEDRLAATLGKDRAHELRVSTHATWMNRFSQAGCASRPQVANP